MAEVVARLDALVATDDVEEVISGQELGRHVGAEHLGEATRVRRVAVLLLHKTTRTFA